MNTEHNTQLIQSYADASPISQWLAFSVEQDQAGLVFRMGFGERHIGNAMIRALHGGGIAAFLEFVAETTLHAHLNGARAFSAINVDIDYLSSARAEDMFGRVALTRVGRRIAFLEAVGWQRNEAQPVAIARIRFKIAPDTVNA